MTCVHHPDVIESRPGTCPYCKMALVPVRLDSAWMCPIHSTVTESNPGTCRLCRRQSVPVTVALTWTCQADPPSSTSSRVHARTGHRGWRSARCARTAITTRSTAGSSSWRPTTGITSKACIPPLACSGSTCTTTSAVHSSPKDGGVQARVVTKETFDPDDAEDDRAGGVSAQDLRAIAPYLEARIDPLHASGGDDREGNVRATTSRSTDSTSHLRRCRRSRAAPAPRARQTQPRRSSQLTRSRRRSHRRRTPA